MFQPPFDQDQEALSEINITPMVDVMLVLCLIFLVTAPLVQQAIPLDLPHAAAQPLPSKAETVSLSLTSKGETLWNETPVSAAALAGRLADLARHAPAPTVLLRADAKTPYDMVARLLAEVQKSGLSQVALITQPSEP
ncbi:ExbD/TolR family protein [Acidithiobacillus sp.]